MINTKRNFSFVQQLTTSDSTGTEKVVATLSGTVTPNRAFSVSLILFDADAAATAEGVTEAFDAFVSDMRQTAKTNGIPV